MPKKVLNNQNLYFFAVVKGSRSYLGPQIFELHKKCLSDHLKFFGGCCYYIWLPFKRI